MGEPQEYALSSGRGRRLGQRETQSSSNLLSSRVSLQSTRPGGREQFAGAGSLQENPSNAAATRPGSVLRLYPPSSTTAQRGARAALRRDSSRHPSSVTFIP